MLTGSYQSFSFLLAALLYYGLDFFLIKRYDRQRQDQRSGRAWDFTVMMLAAGALLVLQPVYLPQVGWRIPGTLGLVIQGVGALTFLAALGLHAWSRLHLRHYYAERVEVQPGHQVVDTGPYALARHPVITSFFGMAIGLLLLNPSILTVILLAYTIWDFSRAARQEEDLLAGQLPGYAAYAARTPRFLPRLWRRP
ncbi:MAG: methyltransferase family protein [Chloroflexota bacterium]